MGALVTIEEAATEFGLHRTSIYRAIQDGRLQRHQRPGSRHTWVDRDEVRELRAPSRLTETELRSELEPMLASFAAEFPAALGAAPGSAPKLAGNVQNFFAKFLEHYGLSPEPTFGETTSIDILYAKGPGYADRPVLAFEGRARHLLTAAAWTFSLFIDLSDEMDAVRTEVGSVRGVASADAYMPDPAPPSWSLAPRRVRIRDPRGTQGWVPATAWALNDKTGEIDVTLGERISFAPGEQPPRIRRLRVKPADYIVEDEPLPGSVESD
jgi:excisionase family DNA binding protein